MCVIEILILQTHNTDFSILTICSIFSILPT